MAKTAAPRPPIPEAESAFINMPYSGDYEERLLALIAGLTLHGLVPTAAMVAGDDPNRLKRILTAIKNCRLSVHDLTWMSMEDADARTARFNMPFELGLAVAVAEAVKNRCVILDVPRSQPIDELSDIHGLDAQTIDGTAMGVFRALSNVFNRNDFQPEPRHFDRVLSRLETKAASLRKGFGFTSLFEAKPFSDLRRLAGVVVNDIHASAAEPGRRPRRRRLTPR